MSDFNGYDYIDKKLELSEGTEHFRESKPEDKKKLEGYEKNPRDNNYYEAMGIKNSFDNVSVGFDKEGQTMISVNSLKEPGAPTLGSDRKLMKANRRIRRRMTYGTLYVNSASKQDGAFSYKADKNQSDMRIYNEFKRDTKSRVSLKQRGAVPFLRLDEDREELSSLRGKSASDNSDYAEREKLEKRVRRETEYRDRFLMKLRLSIRKNRKYQSQNEHERLLNASLKAENDDGDNAPNEDNNEENNSKNRFD